nr:condensin complex subunit 3 isoform X3 [Hydra vulgaris]
MIDLITGVRKVFNAAQDGIVASKLCEQMSELMVTSKEEEFWEAFLDHLKKTMIYYKPETVVEKIIEFCALFATYTSKKKKKENQSIDQDKTLTDETMNPFLLKLFNFLVQNHNSRERAVRYRCCQLITKIFTNMDDDETIDEDLSDSIYECMMYRLKDKLPSIRIQAVLALNRLQDPEDEQCPVIDAFLHSMNTDTNADVRKTVLMNIALSRKTLPHLIVRTRDIKDLNRKAAYLTLSEKVSVRALTIAQRISLLTFGLNERSDMVRQSCIHMLKQWLRKFDNNVVKLLEALDTEGSLECSKLVLEALLKDAPIQKLEEHVASLLSTADCSCGNVKLPSADCLVVENVYFWYMVCQYLKKLGDKGEDLLQQLLPELTHFCDYIQSYAEKNFIDSALLTAFEGKEDQPEFILEYLLKIAGLLDFSDEVGRKRLQQLVRDLLVTECIPLSSIQILVDRYADVEKNENRFMETLIEIIAEVRRPIVTVVTTAMKEKNRRNELQLARIRMNLMECSDDLEKAVKDQDFQQAAFLKNQIADLEKQRDEYKSVANSQEEMTERVEKNDPETILRCLTIASSMLVHMKSREISPMLINLKGELIFEGIKNEDPFIRNEAVKCLGLMSLLNKEFAMQHLLLFVQVLQVDQELLQIMAVKVLFDILLLYGLQAFDADDKENVECEDGETTVVFETPPEQLKSNTRKKNAAEGVLEILLGFLDNESADLYTLVAEGMAKLLMVGHISSSHTLTRLILLWYNPITESEISLRHCLGMFLPTYAFGNISNQRMIEEAFLPVLKTLDNAPSTSPLSQVNTENVIELLLQLTDVNNLVQLDKNKSSLSSPTLNQFDEYVHDSIAVKIANEILSDPDSTNIKMFCKVLNHLNICPRNKSVISDLIMLTSKIQKVLCKNRVAKKMVDRFANHLQHLLVIEGNSSITNNQTTSEKINEEDEQDEDDIEDGSSNTTLTPQEIIKSQLISSCSKKHKTPTSQKVPQKKKMRRDSTESIDFFIKPSPSYSNLSEDDSS